MVKERLNKKLNHSEYNLFHFIITSGAVVEIKLVNNVDQRYQNQLI
jgi:hypothetical protein